MLVNVNLLHMLCIAPVFFALSASASVLHLPIHRRGGRFTHNRPCNITWLGELIAATEHRYSLTYRDVEQNRLVRKWRPKVDAVDDEHLLQSVRGDGSWYVPITIGTPPQQLEFDLDMLSPDFYTIMTTSTGGSRYDTFASRSHESSNDFVHPLCKSATDAFHLSAGSITSLALPMCIPPKTSSLTLLASGSVLGLGPPGYLTRIPSLGLLDQLHRRGSINTDLWSVTILDAENGILSLGGTIAREAEEAKIRADAELQHFGQPDAAPQWIESVVAKKMSITIPEASSLEDHFKWTNVQGPSGWWTTLMSGVWVNGIKILRNQPVLLDIQSPFILAPSTVIHQVFSSVPGSFRLPPPDDAFFAVPCLNKVNVAFEIAGWNFPVMSAEATRSDSLHGAAGGWMSAGKTGNGTGYCISMIAETKMAQHQEWADTGIKGTWVLGEPFFRGMGVVFDQQEQRIGFRSY